MLITFDDVLDQCREAALASGSPDIRILSASRHIPAMEGVNTFFEPLLAGLTDPLNEEEQASGRWEPPPQERVLFEGTIDEAQEFYQQTKKIFWTGFAPIAVYTDGYPIIVPTDDRVREMLKGTSHKPDDLITFQSDRSGWTIGMDSDDIKRKGIPVRFQPMNLTATVEQVAVNAVMAGCKPEYLPVVLAMAESGCSTGTTHLFSQWVCVSGPISKEIGMNSGLGMMDPGNPANATIGRAYQLMAINLGGAALGVNRMSSLGSPFNTGGTCFAENLEGLPEGWKGLNEEHGFKKDESVIMVINQFVGGLAGGQFSPGGYRALQKSGHGALAHRLDVWKQPGPHNFLEYYIPALWADREGPWTFVMAPRMAKHLAEYGFKSKEEIYQWLWKKAFISVKEYRTHSWPDLFTDGWRAIEETSGKHWRELPEDYMVPVGGNVPFDNCIIIGGGPEEVCYQLSGRGNIHGASIHGRDEDSSPSSYPIYNIDAWR